MTARSSPLKRIKEKRLIGSLGRQERMLAIALLLPSILIILLVVGFPMLYSLYLSFTNYTLVNTKDVDIVGLANYIELFNKPAFWQAFGRTVLFISLAVNLEFLIGLGIAQLMARAVKGQGLLRTIMMMPMMFAPILVGFQFKWFFNDQVGLMNNLLYSISGARQIIPWLVDKPLGFISILVAEIWMSTPFMVVILEAGILSLPIEPFEAAEVDGATSWQKFRYLTMPMLMPFVYTAMAIRSLDIGRAYDLVSIMTAGGPGNRTELIWTYVNRLAFSGHDYSLGSSMSYVTVIFSGLFTFYFFRNVIKSRWEGRE
ncbi:MAG: sugar ABC transporter permease [Chloroflexota bacterium]